MFTLRNNIMAIIVILGIIAFFNAMSVLMNIHITWVNFLVVPMAFVFWYTIKYILKFIQKLNFKGEKE